MSVKGWGSIIFATRLEKFVESQFVEEWSELLWQMATELGRPGDGFIVARDRVAHKNANAIVRKFLKTSGDSLLFIDSDASFGPEIINEIRDFKPGWEFDALQAFYTRRGWPPEAIWFTKNALGDLSQNWIVGEGTKEVALIGTHFVLIRREVFERLLAARDPEIDEDLFEWFYYPIHERISEDAAFSMEATEIGVRLGATTGVKVGHISRVVTGWATYLDFLKKSGQWERIQKWNEAIELVAEFIGEDPEIVRAKSARGSENVKEGIDAYLFEKETESPGELNADELRGFYGSDSSGYFYDLINWNATPLYDTVLELLGKIERESVLVVGAGIGGEIEALRDKNGVVAFELPGSLREFLEFRYRKVDSVQIYSEPADIREIIAPPPELCYGTTVAVDTVEHFHPDDFEPTLDKMLELTKPGGNLFFRNNFGDQDIYQVHFDYSNEFRKWVDKRDIELVVAYDNGVEIYLKKEEDNGED